jgi:hypothetical protein
MAEVFIDSGSLVVQIKGFRRFCALKGRIEIPLEKIVSTEEREVLWKEMPRFWQKRHGTNAPWYFGGTFRQKGERVFYDIKRGEKALVITLKDFKFQRLVIGAAYAPCVD